jgi:hypothetical protein
MRLSRVVLDKNASYKLLERDPLMVALAAGCKVLYFVQPFVGVVDSNARTAAQYTHPLLFPVSSRAARVAIGCGSVSES